MQLLGIYNYGQKEKLKMSLEKLSLEKLVTIVSNMQCHVIHNSSLNIAMNWNSQHGPKVHTNQFILRIYMIP